MKVVLLAGGLGTRLNEETHSTPKPMVEIGGKPILWHIMKIYEHYGMNDFIIACGYKGEVIKHFFANFHLTQNSCSFNTFTGEYQILSADAPKWQVSCIDTGVNTLTAGRLNYLKTHLINETFMLTYGDGVANVDLRKLLAFHKNHGKLVTVTAVRPKARFGMLTVDNNQVTNFSEKSQLNEGWINGGFFVFEPGFFDFVNKDEPLEQQPLVRASQAGQLMAYFHDGFWQPMDTLREKNLLEELWQSGNAPWKIWGKKITKAELAEV